MHKHIFIIFSLIIFLHCGGGAGGSSDFESDNTSTPDAPSGITLTPGSSKFCVSWNSVPNATSYTVYYSTSPNPKVTGHEQTYAISPQIIDNWAVTQNTTYVSVSACNDAGESVPSQELTVVPILPAVTGVSTVSGDTKATISWSSEEAASAYNIYYSDSASLDGIKISNVTSPYTIENLTNYTKYYVRITYNNAFFESLKSETMLLTPITIKTTFPCNYLFSSGESDWSGFAGSTSIYNSTPSSAKLPSGTLSYNTDGSGATASASSIVAYNLNYAGANPVLSFMHRYVIPYSGITLNVQISENNGESWTTIANWYGSKGSTLNQSTWVNVVIPLNSYKTKVVMFRFYLTVANGSVLSDNWYIDDITIQ